MCSRTFNCSPSGPHECAVQQNLVVVNAVAVNIGDTSFCLITVDSKFLFGHVISSFLGHSVRLEWSCVSTEGPLHEPPTRSELGKYAGS